ncbi:sporulation protein [Deinococcus multiflagellatus]|uniref:sporulation protein n=1 Tax=Deinococcus multiflagellatus TaxID=1656887 RepID=UPI001CCE806A|nr:sporulation protein [Deinococcus multiflagellatus]MBZ9714614.1 sporulation protein [Deinococcus multiflagellatus]
MGFLKRMMAAVGVGGAKVDAQVHNPTVRIGESVSGVVVVQGGGVEQRIERINLGLATMYKADDTYVHHQLSKVPVIPGFDLRAGERREFPFSIPVAPGTPLTLSGTRVWLATDADIAGAADPGDQDQLQVLPSREMEVLFQAAQQLGFQISGSEVEYHHGRIAQEISFRPPYGQYKIAEIEMMLFPQGGGLDVILEVDRRATGMASLFTSEFEQKGRWHLSAQTLNAGVDAVARELEARIRSLM